LQDDIKMGKKLAQGGFGTVYRGELIEGDGGGMAPVVVKKVGVFDALAVAIVFHSVHADSSD